MTDVCIVESPLRRVFYECGAVGSLTAAVADRRRQVEKKLRNIPMLDLHRQIGAVSRPIDANTMAFKKPRGIWHVWHDEARASRTLVEKFDDGTGCDSSVRLTQRSGDAGLTSILTVLKYGISPGAIVAIVPAWIFLAIAGIFGFIFLLVKK